jgi:dihydropteroate synthase
MCISRPLVMGILNLTPDSFSDGGCYTDPESALRQAERMIGEGADIIDIGGESTRPGSARVSAEEEVQRVAPVIESVANRFDIPISIDTSKSKVAATAVRAGASIINDISGLTFDPEIASIAAEANAGLILMHLRGTFETMHQQPPVDNIFEEVSRGFRYSLQAALDAGLTKENIALDVGIGFSKTFEQNLELIAKLDKLVAEFAEYPILVGASRKSFIGKILDGATPEERLNGSLAVAAMAVERGAKILRVHDVKETVQVLKVVNSIIGVG